MGSAHADLNQPTHDLPGQQALTAIRSRELTPGGGNGAAGRSNHLVLDDTAGEIQWQLKCDLQQSVVSAGHITRIDNHAGRLDARGQGIAAETLGHMALRGQSGMFISTEPILRAHITEMNSTTLRLQMAQGQLQRWGDYAIGVKAQVPDEQARVAADLQQQNEAIAGKPGARARGEFPELGQPMLVLSSPAGIAATTAGSTHWHCGQHFAATVQGHYSVNTQRSVLVSAEDNVRLLARSKDMTAVAAEGNIDLRALAQCINLLAKQVIKLDGENVEINGFKSITLNGGGSVYKLDASGLHAMTGGKHEVKAAAHSFPGPANAPQKMPDMPRAALEEKGLLRMALLSHLGGADGGGQGLAYQPYELFKGGAKVGQGVTDEFGRILVEHQQGDTHYSVRLANGWEYRLEAAADYENDAQRRAGGGQRDRLGDGQRGDDYPGRRGPSQR